MAKYTDKDRRITIPITQEQYDRLRDLIPWGQRYHIMGVLIDGLIKTLEEDTSGALIGAIVAGAVKEDIIIKKGIENRGKLG